MKQILYLINMGYECIVISMMNASKTNKRIFVWISPDIHRRAKAAAALEGKDLQDLVAEALTERIERIGHYTYLEGTGQER